MRTGKYKSAAEFLVDLSEMYSECVGSKFRNVDATFKEACDACDAALNMRDSIEESLRFEIETGITGFVVCVNDEPYPDTFSEDASMTWQLFLPILEADPGLAEGDVRLVKLIEE